MLVRLNCTDNETGEFEIHDFEIDVLNAEGVARGLKVYLDEMTRDDWTVETLAFVTDPNGSAIIFSTRYGEHDAVLSTGIVYTSFYREMF